jgi:Ca2+-binding RTX toxin-like protein
VASNTIIAQASDGGAATLATWTASQTAVFAVAGLNLVGTAGNDTLMGGGAADTLAGGAGTDLLTGGSGDDLYVIDGKAAIVEQSDGGTDAVQSSISYTLPTYVENLTLTGAKAVSGQGNASDNAITGNDAANQLIGRQGDDVLSGHGGADTLNGGQGTDHLFGGAGADVFVFAKGDGADVIHDFGLNGEHDALDLSALYAAGLTATLTDGTAGVTVGFTSGDSIVLLGVHASDLHATSTGYIF